MQYLSTHPAIARASVFAGGVFEYTALAETNPSTHWPAVIHVPPSRAWVH